MENVISSAPMLPTALLSALLTTYTVSIPLVPPHVNFAPIHSLECLTRPIPITLRAVSPPVKRHGAVVVAAECAILSDPTRTYALRMLTDRVDESYIFCMTKDGCPIAEFFFKITPEGTGHVLTLQTRNFRGQGRLFVRCAAEAIMLDLPLWRFDFEQHPELRKYRELVLEDQ